jgi:S-adenosyl-L-methionine hydrolase (adenosine-forming)
MQIVTLTTDFGLQDYYVPALKGALLSRHAALNVVDISHSIKNHDIVQAAFVLKNSWQTFPEGTIHVLSVNNYGGEKTRFLAFEYQKHFFIGPDNGIFTLIFPDSLTPQYIADVPYDGLNFQPISHALAHAVHHITTNEPIETLGYEAEDIVQRILIQPVVNPNQIRGAVIHVDNYDNCILNVTRDLFLRVGHGRSFQLFYRRHEPITRLCNNYNDVPLGETLCLFNADYLEIAIHMGKAAEMLGLKVDDAVQIDFR